MRSAVAVLLLQAPEMGGDPGKDATTNLIAARRLPPWLLLPV